MVDNKCYYCAKPKAKLPRRDPETKNRICTTCYRFIKKLTIRAVCSECGLGPKELDRIHPKTKKKICRGCFRNIIGRIEIGECSNCRKNSRKLYHIDSVTGLKICQECHKRAQGLIVHGICPKCKKGSKRLDRVHPVIKVNICRKCFLNLDYKQDRKRLKGICPVCNLGPKLLKWKRPDSDSSVCYSCHKKSRLVVKKQTYLVEICPRCNRGPKKLSRRSGTNELICERCANILDNKINICPLCQIKFYRSKNHSYNLDGLYICKKCYNTKKLMVYEDMSVVSYYSLVLNSIMMKLKKKFE
ncbi:MAG: hypothetical protein ACD_58C00131G0013 [uncultured bacterium]|nr:MAG: hypothetical protein ACD_58C00131G0013 [uncultured bacterium]